MKYIKTFNENCLNNYDEDNLNENIRNSMISSMAGLLMIMGARPIATGIKYIMRNNDNNYIDRYHTQTNRRDLNKYNDVNDDIDVIQEYKMKLSSELNNIHKCDPALSQIKEELEKDNIDFNKVMYNLKKFSEHREKYSELHEIADGLSKFDLNNLDNLDRDDAEYIREKLRISVKKLNDIYKSGQISVTDMLVYTAIILIAALSLSAIIIKTMDGFNKKY